MRRRSVLLVGLGFLAASCSDDTGTPGTGELGPGRDLASVDGKQPGGDGKKPTGDLGQREYIPMPPPGDGGAGECEGLGNKLRLTFVVKQLDLTSTDVKLVKGSQGVIGFSGSTSDGKSFWFGRDGDPNAAAFDASKFYFVTAAPYHLRLELWPKGSASCAAAGAGCETFYVLNGVLKVVTTTAPTAGTFQVSSVTTQSGCWKDQPSGPPDISKCSIVGGTIYGCFKVD